MFKQCYTVHATSFSIADFMQGLNDITRAHSDAVGLGTDFYLDRDLAWVVARYHIRVLEAVPLEQPLTLTTAPTHFKKMMGYRYYQLQSDRLLVEGFVHYMLINIKTKEAVSVTPELMEGFSVDETLPQHRFSKLSVEGPWEILGQKTVLQEHMDANGHLNNAAYFRYLPALEINEFSLWDVQYKEESFAGDSLTVSRCIDEDTVAYKLTKDDQDVFIVQLKTSLNRSVGDV